MKKIRDYINNINFEEYLERGNKNLTDSNYQDFTIEFWENPSVDITKLKAKYKIHSGISIMNILVQNPIEEYIQLLDDVWKGQMSLGEMVQSHRMKLIRIEQVLFPIEYHSKEDFCPHCYTSNNFEISMKLRQRDVTVRCIECENSVENFIDEENRNNILLKRAKEEEQFLQIINDLREKIKEIKCYNCQGELEILMNDNQTYNVICTSCNEEYKDVETAQFRFNQWKQRAAMMIKIKAREDEILEAALDKKEMRDIKVKKEDIITGLESKKAIQELITLGNKGIDIFKELFGRYIQMSRLDRKILLFVCKECARAGEGSSWVDKNKSIVLTMQEIRFEEPVISVIKDKTKLISVRTSIRRLIDNGLMYCDEEENSVQIHPELLNNIEQLMLVERPQSISNEISYLVFKRQNFVCYHCANTGRPLKVAYLTIDKNLNDLSSLIGICDSCFEDVTKNEVLIDAAITGVFEQSNDLGTSYNFLCYWDEDLRDSKVVIIENEILSSEYEQEDIIRAYAATLYRKHTKGLANDRAFFSYARAILENSEGCVSIYKAIEEKYEIKRWLDKI